MKIIKLEAENFKRLTAVSIEPNGSTVVIGGMNGQGKSSTLDAIEAVLGGAGHAPSDPVRHGAKAARIVLETEDLIVTRKFSTRGAPQLEVKAKNGGVYPSPQTLLNGLVGSLSFDPLAFARIKPAEQAETLRKLVGLDFSIVDTRRKEAFDTRTEVGREIKRLQGAIETLPAVPQGTPDAEVSVLELTAELERRQRAREAKREALRQLGDLRARAIQTQAIIKKLESDLETARRQFVELDQAGPALRAKVDAMEDFDDAALDEVRQSIAGVEATNKAVRAKIERKKLDDEFERVVSESEKLTEAITAFDKQKADAAAAAKYPIEGLAVTDDGLTLGGVPFEQASSAEQLRASIAIGLALNPKLKVLLIRDGSLLDANSLEMVRKMAADADAQVWLERVGTGNEVTVVIEDGQVAGGEPQPVEEPSTRKRRPTSEAKSEPGVDG